MGVSSASAVGFTVMPSPTPVPTAVPVPKTVQGTGATSAVTLPVAAPPQMPVFKNLDQVIRERSPAPTVAPEAEEIYTAGQTLSGYQKILESPLMKFMVVMASQPDVLKNVEEIVNHPAKKKLFYYELALMIALILLRAAVKIRTFGGRVAFSLLSLVIYLACSVWFIPGAVLGQPFYDVVKSAKKAAAQVYASTQNPGAATPPSK